jgi:hypothetical protein
LIVLFNTLTAIYLYNILEWSRFLDKKPFNCEVCTSFWVSIITHSVVAAILTPLYWLALPASLVASFTGVKLYEKIYYLITKYK